MSGAAAPGAPTWGDAALAAALCAVAPAHLGGVALRGMPGPVRETWLDRLRGLLPETAPLRRIPLHVSEGRLLGGLDLAATLSAGRPVGERGLLAESAGGVVVLAMAERAARSTLAHLAAVMDFAEVVLERDGLARRTPAEIGVVALDEAQDGDEGLSPVLLDRLALHVDLRPFGIHDVDDPGHGPACIGAARARLPRVEMDGEGAARLCAVALALGVASLRSCLLAVRVARVSAALLGRERVDESDLAVAARLVLAPRATRVPQIEAPEQAAEDDRPDDGGAQQAAEHPPAAEGRDTAAQDAAQDAGGEAGKPLDDRVLEATVAAIPPQLLAQLGPDNGPRQRAQAAGRSGALQRSRLRGRPSGVLRGDPRAGARLSLIETLRAAAPWQRLRRAQAAEEGTGGPRVLVRRDDFRITRFRQRAETTTIFVVDASGSSALHRLAEAKGAVELLLAECYVRRDQVALIAFRGRQAELLLPPTRSLVRAKRSLAALPGGGGTPLAAGIDAAAALVDLVQRRGGTPSVILLTDGRANIDRDGAQGREQAFAQALDSATALRLTGVRSMVIDTSPRPHANAERLAGALRGHYLPLPHADAAALSRAVQSAAPPRAAH
jgi:magnesium chelatase subunit D